MKFKVGDIVDIGYCKAKIIRESELKGYEWVIQLQYDHRDPLGARKMAFTYLHASYRMAQEFKKVEV